jgi:hypothetical protein
MKQQAVKNIEYPDFEMLKTLDSREFAPQLQDMVQILHKQYLNGIRLFVEKKVSDELCNVDIGNIEFEDIKWLASSIEFFFEDRNLPTSILCLQEKGRHNQPFINRISHYTDNSEEDPCLVQFLYPFYNKDNEQKYRWFNRAPSHIKIWKEVEVTHDHNKLGEEAELVSHLRQKYGTKDYNDVIEEGFVLFSLAIKILLYSSLPQYKIVPISEKRLKRCGKAGVKGRPKRPLFKTIFLPPIINVNKKSKATEDGGTRKPHFRRGHFRMLRDKRFDKQGELIFVRPTMIHGGSMSDKLYVARKLDEARN